VRLAKFAVFGFGLADEQPTAGSATPHTTCCLRSSWRHRTYRRSGGLPVRSSASFEETLIIYTYFYDTFFSSQKNITGVDPAPTGQLLLWNAVKT
jgi:hypothetical protein